MIEEIEKAINYVLTGYKKSTPDYRNIKSDQIVTTPVSFTDLSPATYGGTMMQGIQPSCVEFRIVILMKLYFLEKTGKIIDFNPAFLRKMYNKLYPVEAGAGTSPIICLQIAMKYGCATFATVTDTVSESTSSYEDPSTLTPEAMTEALQYLIPGYVDIPVNASAFTVAIEQYGMIGVGMNVNARWYTSADGSVSWLVKDVVPLAPDSTEFPVISGHFYGLTASVSGDDYFVVDNQWSEEWANKGQNLLKFSDFEGDFLEAVAISEVPQAFLDLIKNLPRQDEFAHNFETDLAPGATGAEVTALQIALIILGYLTLNPDINLGFYGPLTEKAVIALQEANASTILLPIGLTEPTGNVGGATREYLNSVFNK
jgi:hypothetical protein